MSASVKHTLFHPFTVAAPPTTFFLLLQRGLWGLGADTDDRFEVFDDLLFLLLRPANA